MISGANNIEAIVNYTEAKIDWFKESSFLPYYLVVIGFNGSTGVAFGIWRIYQRSRIKTIYIEPDQSESIAIDGKTSRGTARTGIKALHMVSLHGLPHFSYC